MGADRDESRVELPGVLLSEQVGDLVVQHDTHAHRLDAGDFLRQVGAGQTIGRNAEMQHAAGDRTGFVDLHRVAEAGEVIGGGQPAGTGAYDQDALAARRTLDARRPAFARRHVAEEPLDRMDADRGIEVVAVTTGFARMVADPPMHRRQRVVAHDRVPGLPVFPRLRQIEPCLDVLAGWAGVIAGRHEVDIDRPPGANRTGALLRGSGPRSRSYR